MKTFTLLILILGSVARSQDSDSLKTPVQLNPKGVWYLHQAAQKFGCKTNPEVTTNHENLVVIDVGTCNSHLISKDVARSYAYRIFWYGIDDNEQFIGVTIPSEGLSWNVSDDNFKFSMPEKISIYGRDFIKENDSTYRVERHGMVVVEDFKTRYFDNCVYNTDTLNAVSMIRTWGDRWIVNIPCSPYHMTKQDQKLWGEDPKWEYYALPCIIKGGIKMKTIALSTDGIFRWNWGLGNIESLTAGTYTIENDTLLVLQSDFDEMEKFVELYRELYPEASVSTKYLIQRQYVIRDDKIYFVNEYR
ncbi:MAG: hypothetical protein HUJ25_16410 [Crocinitomicaceae bacterium]|nr:hypothetical protein [Crocinitomicaceae bacterium]